MGSPQASVRSVQMPKHAGGARCLPQSRRWHSTSVSRARALAVPPIHAGPCTGSIGVLARRRSISDRGASLAPIRCPPDNLKRSLTLFSKSFSSFPRGTCSLSVSRPYLALDGIHRPIWAAFPNNPTRRQRLVVRQGPGTTGLSPSPAPPSRGLGPGPPLRTLLQTTIRTTEPPDSKAGLFPVRSPLLRESLPAASSRRMGGQYLPATTAHPMIEARCEGATRCVTPRQTCQRPNGFGRNLRSKTRWFMGFCNSHQLSHVVMFFIDARVKISVAESCFYLPKKHRSPRRTPRMGREGQAIDLSIPWRFLHRGSPTETLLRLLLPLNDKVQWTSRDVAGSEPPTSPRSEHFTGSFNRYAAQETDFEQAYDALAPRLRWQAGQDVAARAGIQPNCTCRTQLTRRASKCYVDACPTPAPTPGKRCRALLPMRTLQGLKQVPLDTIARPVGGAEEMKARSAHARAPATTAAGARQRIGLGRMRAAPGACSESSIHAMVPWCLGATVPRRHGALVPWRHAALVSWCHGAMVPRCIAALVPWCLGALVPWRHGAKQRWCHGACVPRCHGATVLVCHGAMVPRCLCATVLWCHGACVPSCLGAMVPV
ncbi:Protein TAR1 [Capsicum baccatum]|uniref:Protein TAR1 n=1 Tax=Capsicum baccatum TaxID=33114 RepID=A0A2G2UXC5_CAPBA|nr:Protein TAR1 [Capsicum baccatum]